MTSAIDWAREYISRGWRPIPIEFRSKLPPAHFRAGWSSLEVAAESVAEIFRGNVGVGIRLGTPSCDLTDVDLDSPTARRIAHLFLPETGAVFGRAGSPHSHWLYHAKGSTSAKFTDPCAADGERSMLVEIRSDGCQTVVPPSTHVSGEIIEWSTGDATPANVDANVLRRAVERLAAATLLIDHFPAKGSRDETAFALAGLLIRAGWSVEGAEEFMRLVATEGGAADVEAKVAKVSRAKARFDQGEDVVGERLLSSLIDTRIVAKVAKWLTLPRAGFTSTDVRARCTDVANAERFASFAGAKIRYCYLWKTFLVWTGERWLREQRGEVTAMAVEVVKSIHTEAAHAVDSHERTVLSKWALASESKNRLDAMVSIARSRLSVLPDEFDAQPYDLNVANGTVDLRTGTLRSHNPQDLITQLIPIPYHPSARCDRWVVFLNDVMEGDEEMVSFLQLATGYSLTADTGEQCLFLLHGRGANGKSTFLEVILAICGEYARPTDFRTLSMRTFGDAIRNDIAALRGLRMVSASETNRGRRFDEALVKQLTGSDKITARFLYGELFDFVPSFKIWLAANVLPGIEGTDDGIWRRVRVLPFRARFTSATRVKNLHKQLIAAEGQGILAWAIRGARLWLDQGGLPEPRQVREATHAYRVQSDDVGAFLKAECKVPDLSAGDLPDQFFAAAGALFACYQHWCCEGGLEALKANGFSAALQERGFRPATRWDGDMRKQVRIYRGLRLAPERHHAF